MTGSSAAGMHLVGFAAGLDVPPEEAIGAPSADSFADQTAADTHSDQPASTDAAIPADPEILHLQTGDASPPDFSVSATGSPPPAIDVAIDIHGPALPVAAADEAPPAESPIAAAGEEVSASDTGGARLAVGDWTGDSPDSAIAIISPEGGLPGAIEWMPIIDPLPPFDDSSKIDPGEGGGGDDGGSETDTSGTGSYDYSGYWAASAGDVNGDGFDDQIISAYAYADGVSSSSSYIVFGSAEGPREPPDPAALDGSNGFRIDGGGTSNYGPSVAAAGDVNGDGFADLIVTAYDGEGNTSNYVVFGNAAVAGGKVDVSALDGASGFQIVDSSADDSTTLWLSAAGDVNDDGIADLAVESSGTDADGNWIDASYIVFGTAAGFHGSIDIAALDGANGYKIEVGDDTGGGSGDEGDGTAVLDPPIAILPICVIYASDEVWSADPLVEPEMKLGAAADFLV